MKSVDSIKNKVNAKRNANAGLMGSEETKQEENVNINNDVNSTNDPLEGADELDAIVSGKKASKFDKELVGIYFTPDVKAGLDRLQQAEGRGKKSDLLNDLARYALKKKGYMK